MQIAFFQKLEANGFWIFEYRFVLDLVCYEETSIHMDVENLANHAQLPAYFGIPTFMRQPATRDVHDIDVVVMGIPFDSGATSYRSGARFGPRKIREASLLLWGYNRFFKIAPLDRLRVADYGDVSVSPVSLEATVKLIC